jgi:hypothetical protein
MLKIVKHKGHGTLKGHSDIFKTEMHFSVCKGTPRTNKRHLVLILKFYLNLIITWKSIHKRKDFTYRTLINNLVNKGSGEVMFRTRFVHVPKIHTYMDGFFLLIYENGVGHPFGQGNQVDEANIKQLLHLYLNSGGLPKINNSKTFQTILAFG